VRAHRLLVGVGLGISLIAVVGVGVFAAKSHQGRQQANSQSQHTTSSQAAQANGGGPVDCTAASDDRHYRTDRSLAVDPNNGKHLFVAIEYKGAYQSYDGGKTWKQTLQDFTWRNGCFPEPFQAFISPTDSKVIYISTNGNGIIKTTDGGKTWKGISKSWMYNRSEDFALDPTNDHTLYAASADIQGAPNPNDNSPATKGLVYKSTDSGASWAELPTGLKVGAGNNGMVVSRADPKHLLVFTLLAHFEPGGRQIDTSGQMGILSSADGGATWTALHTIPAGHDATGFMAHSPLVTDNIYVTSFTAPGTPEVDYASRDFGQTWEPSNTVMAYVFYDPFDATGLHVYGVNDQPNVNTANAFYESKDGGRTWNQTIKFPAEVTNAADHKTLISNIQWDPTNRNVMYVSAASGYVWESTDSGQTWQKILSADTLPK
jgi:photosystem II stability/assembly factor-like uncharacterized protein